MSFCLAGFTSIAFAQKIDLKNNWMYREEKTQKWYSASVPGEIHTDLLNSKLIPDPFYRDSEKKTAVDRT
ncbi:hypothetical protein AAFH68_24810 [Flavobacterium sp. CGRL1]